MSRTNVLASAIAAALGAVGTAATAQDAAPAVDIRENCCVWAEGLVGPGSLVVETVGDIQFSIGMLARVIPTYERDWDFGIGERLPAGATFGADPATALGKDFFATHFSEAGVLGGDYIRNQFNLFLNILPDDKKWSAYVQLQMDQAMDIRTLDNVAGAGNFTSDFGVERLHLTTLLPVPGNVRLHGGWDYWEVDTIEGPGLVFGDDSAGVWLTGAPNDKLFWNAGYWVLREMNAGGGTFADLPFGGHISDEPDNDREMIGGFMDFKFAPNQKIRGFYLFDNIRDNPVVESAAALFGAPTGIVGGRSDAQVHNLGAYYKGNLGNLELFGEGIYKFGEVENAGLTGVVPGGRDDYDISSFALAAFARYEMKDAFNNAFGTNWKSFKPGLYFMYTSGDDDPTDGDLEGYTAVMADQKFSQWGGHDSFMDETHWVLGTPVFGFLPEGLGNGTPVFVGGIENFSGLGFGRGDNPGISIISLGLTAMPRERLAYTTKAHAIWWNEEQIATNVVTGGGFNRTAVEDGYVGTNWINEVAWSVNKNMSMRFQASWFFPGSKLEDLTSAIAVESDDVAQRYAVELVWSF